MTITISLSPEEERKLQECAARDGQDLAGYIHRFIERAIQGPATLDETLAPFRRQVEESGMSDEELGAFFEEARDEVERRRCWTETIRRPARRGGKTTAPPGRTPRAGPRWCGRR